MDPKDHPSYGNGSPNTPDVRVPTFTEELAALLERRELYISGVVSSEDLAEYAQACLLIHIKGLKKTATNIVALVDDSSEKTH